MKSMKTYLSLPTLRIPGWKELRDGSFLSQALEKTDKTNEISVLKDFEGKLVRVQEVAVWSSPGVSLAWVLVTQASLYYVTSISSTSLVSGLAYTSLSLYLYLTWVYTVWPAVRVPPSPEEDSETFTPVHPDVMSAPEMETLIRNFKSRLVEIVRGFMLLRQEKPGRFCLVLSSLFLMMAILGTKVTLAVLIHTVLLAFLVIPALVARAGRNDQLSPVLKTLTECLSSFSDMLIYRGKDAPVHDNTSKLLEEFVPDSSEENTSLLSKALLWKEKPDKEAEFSLTENASIPSHDEVENDSLTNLLEFEHGLQPPAPFASNQNLGKFSDSESGENSNAIKRLKHFQDSDTEDSLDLEQELSRSLIEETTNFEHPSASSAAEAPRGAISSVRAPNFEEELRQSLTTGLAESVTSSVTSLVSGQVSSILAAVTGPQAHRRRSSDLDDFEIIDEDELDEDSI